MHIYIYLLFTTVTNILLKFTIIKNNKYVIRSVLKFLECIKLVIKMKNNVVDIPSFILNNL